MSLQKSPVVKRREQVSLHRGRGGRRKKEHDDELHNDYEYNELRREINQPTQDKIGEKRAQEYSLDLRSRFGEAFLPFASQLESVRKAQTTRKREGKNRRKEPVKITKIPKNH